MGIGTILLTIACGLIMVSIAMLAAQSRQIEGRVQSLNRDFFEALELRGYRAAAHEQALIALRRDLTVVEEKVDSSFGFDLHQERADYEGVSRAVGKAMNFGELYGLGTRHTTVDRVHRIVKASQDLVTHQESPIAESQFARGWAAAASWIVDALSDGLPASDEGGTPRVDEFVPSDGSEGA